MSNLPPGVTEGMIPGNRPEDEEYDDLMTHIEIMLDVGKFEEIHFLLDIAQASLVPLKDFMRSIEERVRQDVEMELRPQIKELEDQLSAREMENHFLRQRLGE